MAAGSHVADHGFGGAWPLEAAMTDVLRESTGSAGMIFARRHPEDDDDDDDVLINDGMHGDTTLFRDTAVGDVMTDDDVPDGVDGPNSGVVLHDDTVMLGAEHDDSFVQNTADGFDVQVLVGGQGAPLHQVPHQHHAMLSDDVVVNDGPVPASGVLRDLHQDHDNRGTPRHVEPKGRADERHPSARVQQPVSTGQQQPRQMPVVAKAEAAPVRKVQHREVTPSSEESSDELEDSACAVAAEPLWPDGAASQEKEVAVRVVARIRPRIRAEKRYKACCFADGNTVFIDPRVFAFNRVYGPASQQKDIFDDCIAPLLSRCFDGVNVTVFAYGQTNAGKSFTMGTERQDLDTYYKGRKLARNTGVVPRFADLLFKKKALVEKQYGTKCEVKLRYLEIYNEEFRDLLDDDVQTARPAWQGRGSTPRRKVITIRDTMSGSARVAGCCVKTAKSVKEFLSLFHTGCERRTTGSTAANRTSSRSHAVLTAFVFRELPGGPADGTGPHGGDAPGMKVFGSHVNLVDLAGSERQNKTKNFGKKLGESKYINKSLFALSRVISSLSELAAGRKSRSDAYVAFRDSKLTRILADSLGGSALTLIIACCSPADGDYDETMNSLEYAERARRIRNAPMVHVEDRSPVQPPPLSGAAAARARHDASGKRGANASGAGDIAGVRLDEMYQGEILALKKQLEEERTRVRELAQSDRDLRERLGDALTSLSDKEQDLEEAFATAAAAAVAAAAAQEHGEESIDLRDAFVCKSSEAFPAQLSRPGTAEAMPVVIRAMDSSPTTSGRHGPPQHASGVVQIDQCTSTDDNGVTDAVRAPVESVDKGVMIAVDMETIGTQVSGIAWRCRTTFIGWYWYRPWWRSACGRTVPENGENRTAYGASRALGRAVCHHADR